MESILFAQNVCKTGHNLEPYPWNPRMNHESWNPRNPCSPRIKEFFKELAVRTVNVHRCFSWLVAVSTVTILYYTDVIMSCKLCALIVPYSSSKITASTMLWDLWKPPWICPKIGARSNPVFVLGTCRDLLSSGFFSIFFCPKFRTLVGLI